MVARSAVKSCAENHLRLLLKDLALSLHNREDWSSVTGLKLPSLSLDPSSRSNLTEKVNQVHMLDCSLHLTRTVAPARCLLSSNACDWLSNQGPGTGRILRADSSHEPSTLTAITGPIGHHPDDDCILIAACVR
eukprot:766792-Hanusia_phi.AAC.4